MAYKEMKECKRKKGVNKNRNNSAADRKYTLLEKYSIKQVIENKK